MLSIAPINNTSYYEELADDKEQSNGNEDYYSEAQEAAGNYYGQGSHMLNLTGALKNGDLDKLLQGFNPETNKPVASNAGNDHRKGWDLTFSAPKSYSLLLSDPDHRDQAINLHRQAVSKAVEYIENNVVNCREGSQGNDLTKANLICAGYTHTSSRALDMQLHEHLLVNSHALNDNGESKSIDGRRLYDFKEAAGAVYRAELAKLTELELGLKTEKDGQSFRIAGNTQDFEKEQSKRREQIKEKLDDKGLNGGKASAAATLDTRNTKVRVDKNELQKGWETEASKHDYSVNNLLEQQQELNINNEYNINNVIDKLTDNDSAFTVASLHKIIAQEMQCVDSDMTIEDRVNELEESKQLISLGIDGRTGLQQFTTQHMIDLEKGIKDFADSTQNKDNWEIKDKSLIEHTAQEFTLNQEQEQAYNSLLGKGQFVSTIGAGGTGKTHMLNAVKAVYESQGFNVQGLAPTGKVAANLTADGIQSSTLDSFLLGVKYGNVEVNNKTVLMLDEAAMIHTKNYHKLQKLVEDKGAKLISVGDAQQIQSVQAGGVFNLLTKDNNKTIELVQNMRQKIDWQAQAATDFREGNTKQALQAYAANNALHIDKTDRKTHNKIVSTYNNISAEQNEKLIFATKNSDIDKINKLVRQSLKKQGNLAVSTTIQSAKGKMEVAIGDRITTTKNASKKLHNMKSKAVLNGDLGTVKDININKDGETILTVELDRGKTIELNTSNYNDLRHAYCISSHRSQGSTYKHGLMFVSGSFSNKEMGYVMASRHKESLEIFSSEESLLSKHKDLSELSEVAKAEKANERLIILLGKEDKKLTAVEQVEKQRLLDERKEKELKELLEAEEEEKRKKKYLKEEEEEEQEIEEQEDEEAEEKQEIKDNENNLEQEGLENNVDNSAKENTNENSEPELEEVDGLEDASELELEMEIDLAIE